MQKFTVDIDTFINAYADFLQSRQKPYSPYPESVILEGELLEGGTVEKSAIGDCIYGGFCIHHLCKDFNRETPKEKFPVYKHPLEGSDFLKGNSKEEVKLPEPFNLDDTNAPFSMLQKKLNGVIRYLASKEAGDK